MDMPKSVRYAIRLLYLGVISYFIANALSIAGIAGARGDVQYMMVFLTLFLCAVYCLLISRITERGKLALILVTIFGVVSILNLLTQIGEIFKGDPLVLAFSLGANFLQAVALVLLFLPMSREWFRPAQQVEDVS